MNQDFTENALATRSVPHGGRLIDRLVPGEERGDFTKRLAQSPSITLDDVALSDVSMIADGALSPLTGFMDRADYESVVQGLRLLDGSVWSIPITLPVSEAIARTLKREEIVALLTPDGRLVASLKAGDVWQPDLTEEARQVYRTEDRNHPGVARLFQRGDWYAGGEIRALPTVREALNLNGRYSSPAELREIFKERGWKQVVAFQTRNPVHRAHEYIQKCALEMVDGLLLHPLVGQTKNDDIPADVRLKSYDALLANYYPANRVVLSVLPAAMRYAGPREAIFHALVRKNYGCTHFIVGRDHAGVGNYYGTYDAQRIFDSFAPEEIGIRILCFDHTFYCRRCDAIVSEKTCPHSKDDHLVFSGTQIRDMLSRGEPLPAQYSRPEVVAILISAMSGNGSEVHA